MSASYDCSVCYCTLEGSTATLDARVQGPWDWADALFLEESGRRLVVQVIKDQKEEATEDSFKLFFFRTKQYLNFLCGISKAAPLFPSNFLLLLQHHPLTPPSGQVARSQ